MLNVSFSLHNLVNIVRPPRPGLASVAGTGGVNSFASLLMSSLSCCSAQFLSRVDFFQVFSRCSPYQFSSLGTLGLCFHSGALHSVFFILFLSHARSFSFLHLVLSNSLFTFPLH